MSYQCVLGLVLITILHTIRISEALVHLTVSPSTAILRSTGTTSYCTVIRHHRQRRSLHTHIYLSNLPIPFTLALPPPDVEKTRLVLQIKGDTVNNALFRAELKKELTFFRGCSAVYIQNGEDTAEVVTEGKTKKLLSFLDWLSDLSLSVSQRKPSFQGPSLVGR